MEQTNDILRPNSLDGFIGQEHYKEQVRVALASAKERHDSFPHLLMAGPPGLGKTTLANIIAEEMGQCYFIPIMATAIRSEEDIQTLFMNLPADGYNKEGEVEDPSKVESIFIFIDEIHTLKKKITELLHTALEDFVVTIKTKDNYSGQVKTQQMWCPHFCMIGATNYIGSMPKPFVDRFPMQMMFEAYNEEEIGKILVNSAARLGLECSIKGLVNMAMRSRGVPRIANRFLLHARDTSIAYKDKYKGKISDECVQEMFKIQQIDESGLSRLDRKVLDYLAKVNRPVGVKSIAQGVDEDTTTIENSVEPWLVQQKLIIKTPSGRVITPEGREHLGLESGRTSNGPSRIIGG